MGKADDNISDNVSKEIYGEVTDSPICVNCGCNGSQCNCQTPTYRKTRLTPVVLDYDIDNLPDWD